MHESFRRGLCALGIFCALGCLPLMSGTAQAAETFPTTTLTIPLTRVEVKEISNVVYEQVPSRGFENVAMKMDIFRPQTKELKPAVIYVTGGGFINANKDNGLQQRMALAQAGYVVASIEYRVTPTAIMPQPLQDVKAAIRFLKANAEKFGVDKNRIGLMGGSAGGYLVNMAGATNGMKEFDVGENLQESSDVQAVCSLYGLSDLTRVGDDYSEEIQQKHRSAGATEALWIHGSPVFGGGDGGVQDDPERADACNPLNYISDATPPFLLMAGTADVVVSPSQSDLMYQALKKKGVQAERYLLQDAAHGGKYWVQPEVIDLIVSFFNKNLKGE